MKLNNNARLFTRARVFTGRTEKRGTQLKALDEKMLFEITRISDILPERPAKVDEFNGKQPCGLQMPSY
jgi:hypothetical protein